MESYNIDVLSSEKEMKRVFEKDPIILVKFYRKNTSGNGYLCTIRYPECNKPIKDGSVFSSWAECRKAIMNRHVRYMNKQNKLDAGVSHDSKEWLQRKKQEISEIYSDIE